MDFTITFPCRNRVKMANKAIQTFLESCDYTILIIDDNSDSPDDEYIKSDRVKVIYNKYKSGLVSMWNQALREIDTEYVIIGCDKIRVTNNDILRIENKLKEGYSCVATYLLGIFGFSKELTTRVGFFDEGYEVNGFEDTDWMNKLFINNLSLYVSTETEYLNTGTSWGPANMKNSQYYRSKWNEDFGNNQIIQLKKDINYNDINIFKGQYENKNYLDWSSSELKAENINNYYNNKKGVKNILNGNL
tara:strand:- start:12417 stop:13157 length:741 start_codon:yes stop_codon:yes gene_type:complete